MSFSRWQNVKKYTDAANSLTTEYDYDDAGRVARSVVNKENSSAYNGSRVQYAYSKGGKIANLSYDTGDGKIKSYVYTYAKDGLPEKSVFPDASCQTLSYDNLRRNSQKVYYPVKNAAAAKRLYTTAAFTEGQSSASSHKGTTTLVKTYTNKIGTADVASEYAYAYDEWGNVTGITESVRGNKGTYTYNEYGELTKAVEVYTKNKTAQSTCTYDAMGNPTNYMGAAMTWDVKGNLTSVSGRNGKSASYTYLSDGQRYTKTTGGKTTTYLYNNGLLLSETTGNEVINYYYDSDGTILGIGYKKGSNDEKHYFFEKNAFGDVIAVYRNSDSVLIGTYEYDLWGNPVSVNEAASGRDTDGILQKNPFRYRCYYYDTETGFYYLNARYYDPMIRRWISPEPHVLANLCFVHKFAKQERNMVTDMNHEKKFFYNYIEQIINEWDPLDLFPSTLGDKYLTEIKEIEGILKNTNDPIKLADEIYEVFKKKFDNIFKKSKSECEQIARILLSQKVVKKIIDEWDPIDLFPGAPDDEYWTEIEAIEPIFRDLDDPVKLSEGIYEVFVKEFDDVFKKSKSECEQIARILLSQKEMW